MSPRALAAVAVLAAASVLSACSVSSEEDPVTLTLDAAKSEVLVATDDLLALVPEEIVTERFPRTETSRVLFACDDPDTYYWPGGAQLGIDPSTDAAALFDTIHEAWAERDGWEITWKERGESGVYHLDLYRSDGLHLAVMNLESNTVLDISGFSPCFVLEDYDPNRAY